MILFPKRKKAKNPMTDETKKLFDAPWRVDNRRYPFDVTESDGFWVCECATLETANRLARLPELYDKLMWAVVQKCPDAFLALDECRLCPDKKCKYREIVELLRKVRDGE